MGTPQTVDNETVIADAGAGSITTDATGYDNFSDFVEFHDYTVLTDIPWDEMRAKGLSDTDIIAGAVSRAALNSDPSLNENSVVINQSVGTAVTIVAVPGEDGSTGSLYYVSADKNSGIISVHEESITITEDGRIESSIEGEIADTRDINVADVVDGLTARFADVSGANSLFANFVHASNGNMVMGGATSAEGEVRLDTSTGQPVLTSAAAASETTGVEIGATYHADGTKSYDLTVHRTEAFRQGFEEITEPLESQAVDPESRGDPDNIARHDQFMGIGNRTFSIEP